MSRNTKAAILAFLGAVVAILLTISLVSSDTSETQTVASDVDSVTPAPGALLGASIEADLAEGLTGRLVIDSIAIPNDELEAFGLPNQIIFKPGEGKVIEDFAPGEHVAEVFFWPDDEAEPTIAQSYVWEFRTTT